MSSSFTKNNYLCYINIGDIMKQQLLKEQKNKKNNLKFTKWFLIFISIFSIGLIRKPFLNDTFYTIKIGELILNNGIDMMDHFSFHQNLAYTYPHWLYDCFIYLVYYLGGYTGIYISTILLFLLLIYLVFKTNIKLNSNYSLSAFSTFVCVISVAGFATARAQLVSFILFVLEIYFIESFLQNGNKKNLWGLLIVSLLLCNVHIAVWPFYFILYLPFLVEFLVALIVKKINLKKTNKFTNFLENHIILEHNKNIKYLFITMLISLSTGLLTPIGDAPYTYLIKTMLGNSQDYILEHQMMGWIDSPFTIIIVFETIFLYIISKIKLRDLFMVSGLALMSIISIRHISLLALIGTICFARTFVFFFENYKLQSDPIIIPFLLKKKSTIIAFTSIIILTTITFSLQQSKSYINKEEYPVEAVKYIKKNLDINNIRLYNDYNFGSYLILEEIPVFIDSRADLYTKQFSGFEYDIFDDYYYMANIYQQKFEDYQITHALIYKKDNELYNRLKIDKLYKILYEDDFFILYEKTGTPDYIITY